MTTRELEQIGSSQIYLAHPIASSSPTTKAWVKEFKRAYGNAGMQYKLLDPERYKLVDGVHDARIVYMNKREIAKSKAVVAYFDTLSAGVAMEVLFAWMLGTPCFVYRHGKVPAWITIHATLVTDRIERIFTELKKL